MKLASGRIRDFRKPDPDKKEGPQILSAVGSGIPQQEPPPQNIEVTVHEEVILEGQDKIREKVYEDGIEIRVRAPKDATKWDEVKRGEDE